MKLTPGKLTPASSAAQNVRRPGGLLTAQGVTNAAIQGGVLREDGSPIPEATVTSPTLYVTNTLNGRRRTGGRTRWTA